MWCASWPGAPSNCMAIRCWWRRTDGRQIDVLKKHSGPIELVVLDLSMPHMNGEELLPQLRKVRPDVKVVVSSGYSESEVLALFQGQRVSGFIQKPYTSKSIAERVKASLLA